MIDQKHGGNIREYFKASRLSNKTILDFSVNTNPLGLPPSLKQAIEKNITNLINYPDPECWHLKKSIANFHKININNLIIGNGSIELIYLIPWALQPKRALITTPTFSEYEFALKLNKARAIFIKSWDKNGYRIATNKIIKLIPMVNMIFLCNPNNPTGALINGDEILYLVKLCKKYKTILIIDEAFMDFVENSQHMTMLYKATEEKILLVLRSLTKFFSIPGLRLGYLIGHKNLITKLSLFLYPWNVNSIAQIAGAAVIKEENYIKKSKELILKEKKNLFNRLKTIEGLKLYPPSANFILSKLENSSITNSQVLNNKLLRQGIVIRPGYNFRGLSNKFFRVAVKKREENLKLIDGLRKILNNGG